MISIVQTPSFWVLVGFILFIAFFGKTVASAAFKWLDDHIDHVKKQLDNAESLYQEASELLKLSRANYEREVLESNAIVASGLKEFDDLKQHLNQELTSLLEKNNHIVQDRIHQALKSKKRFLLQKTIDKLEEGMVLMLRDPKSAGLKAFWHHQSVENLKKTLPQLDR